MFTKTQQMKKYSSLLIFVFSTFIACTQQIFAEPPSGKDANTGSGRWHWILFNIPATVTELKQEAGDPSKNLFPKGAIQALTDFGQPVSGGQGPPEGDKPHQYIITIHALKTDNLV